MEDLEAELLQARIEGGATGMSSSGVRSRTSFFPSFLPRAHFFCFFAGIGTPICSPPVAQPRQPSLSSTRASTREGRPTTFLLLDSSFPSTFPPFASLPSSLRSSATTLLQSSSTATAAAAVPTRSLPFQLFLSTSAAPLRRSLSLFHDQLEPWSSSSSLVPCLLQRTKGRRKHLNSSVFLFPVSTLSGSSTRAHRRSKLLCRYL